MLKLHKCFTLCFNEFISRRTFVGLLQRKNWMFSHFSNSYSTSWYLVWIAKYYYLKAQMKMQSIFPITKAYFKGFFILENSSKLLPLRWAMAKDISFFLEGPLENFLMRSLFLSFIFITFTSSLEIVEVVTLLLSSYLVDGAIDEILSVYYVVCFDLTSFWTQ